MNKKYILKKIKEALIQEILKVLKNKAHYFKDCVVHRTQSQIVLKSAKIYDLRRVVKWSAFLPEMLEFSEPFEFNNDKFIVVKFKDLEKDTLRRYLEDPTEEELDHEILIKESRHWSYSGYISPYTRIYYQKSLEKALLKFKLTLKDVKSCL